MNKGVIFAVGAAIGAAAGSIATYFIVKNHFDEVAADAIERYAEYAENKIQEALDRLHDDSVDDDEDEEDDSAPRTKDNRAWSEEDEAPIKKYHHYVPEQQILSANSIFVKNKGKGGEKGMTEGEKALLENPHRFDDPNIIELDEDHYQELVRNPEEVDEDLLVYLYPQDELWWNYDDHDHRELAEVHYNLGREKIVGQTWRWATDYTGNDSGIGYCYLNNLYLDKILNVEVIVDLDLEEDEE